MTTREWVLQNYNRPVTSFYRPADNGPSRDYILDPRYQRGSVWTLEQRQALVLSMIEGLPIGALFLNDRGIGEYAVVDGKQRIETIQMWAAGEFSVPSEWFGLVEPTTADGDTVTYPELPARWQRRLDNFCVSTYVTEFHGRDAEASEIELFNRVNFGGTPQEGGPR